MEPVAFYGGLLFKSFQLEKRWIVCLSSVIVFFCLIKSV